MQSALRSCQQTAQALAHQVLPPGPLPSRMPFGGPSGEAGTATHMRPLCTVTSPWYPCRQDETGSGCSVVRRCSGGGEAEAQLHGAAHSRRSRQQTRAGRQQKQQQQRRALRMPRMRPSIVRTRVRARRTSSLADSRTSPPSSIEEPTAPASSGRVEMSCAEGGRRVHRAQGREARVGTVFHRCDLLEAAPGGVWDASERDALKTPSQGTLPQQSKPALTLNASVMGARPSYPVASASREAAFTARCSLAAPSSSEATACRPVPLSTPPRAARDSAWAHCRAHEGEREGRWEASGAGLRGQPGAHLHAPTKHGEPNHLIDRPEQSGCLQSLDQPQIQPLERPPLASPPPPAR